LSRRTGALTETGEGIFGQFLAMNGSRVIESVGDGAFEYEGVQSVQDPHLTIWRLKVYGGVRLSDDPKAPHEDARHIWVTTSKSDVFLKLRELEPHDRGTAILIGEQRAAELFRTAGYEDVSAKSVQGRKQAPARMLLTL